MLDGRLLDKDELTKRAHTLPRRHPGVSWVSRSESGTSGAVGNHFQQAEYPASPLGAHSKQSRAELQP